MLVPHSVILEVGSEALRFDFESQAAALDYLRVPTGQRWEAEHTLARCAAWIADSGSLDGVPFLSTVYPTARLAE